MFKALIKVMITVAAIAAFVLLVPTHIQATNTAVFHVNEYVVRLWHLLLMVWVILLMKFVK